MKNSICILHWMPVEYFPPVINLARYFAEQERWQVSLCTNRNSKGRPDFAHPAVAIVRGSYPAGRRGISRIWAYASFHLQSWWHLLKTRPDIVLYIEPHSALPVFLARWLFRRSRLFIHYHEYHSPDEFERPGMRMAKWFYRLEKGWLYPAAKWISQTNPARLDLFLQDNPEVDPSKAVAMPNYPPATWWEGENGAWSDGRQRAQGLRFVYVGALSRVDTYIEEAVNLIRSMGPMATLDIYSSNFHEEARSYLLSIDDAQIRLHDEGVDYDELPRLLRDFHVGLILYRGNTPNYVHNASNKLFEYLACDLDVIFPKEMEGVKPYASSVVRPRVIECDFADISGFAYRREGRQELPSRGQTFCCETVLARLEHAMLDGS